MHRCPGLCGSWWSGPVTEVLHHWAQENMGWRGVRQGFGVFFTTDGAQ